MVNATMTKARSILAKLCLSLTVAAAIGSLCGCHKKDPDLGPTEQTQPPANIQAGKGGSVIQGGATAAGQVGGGK